MPVGELAKFTPTFNGGGNALVFRNTKYNDTKAGLTEGGLWLNESKTCNASFNSIGNNVPHNNMSPFIACYGWYRTA